jgi:Flp pilus assembly protein TadB
VIPILLGIMAAASVILLFAGFQFSDTKRRRALDKSLAPRVTNKRGLIQDGDVKDSFVKRYMKAWERAAQGAGMSDGVAANMAAIMMVVSVMTGILIYAVTQVIVISVFVSLAPPAGFWLRLSSKASKRSVLIEKQMSAFVVSIHMYIQSGLQPVTAIMQAVDACPEPLKGELSYLVISLKNNENERTAFRKLRDRTTNPELKELCSNISIALAEGSDIGKQLMNLGETVRAKGELRGKIQNLLQDPRMTSVIGFLSFFVFFTISWFSQEDAQAVWSTLMGSLVLIGCSAMAAGGGVWAFRIVKKAQEVS